jgi:hypothetical protein
MISSKNHCSLVVACWNYHFNAGNKFFTVWAYNTGKELYKYIPTRKVTTITQTILKITTHNKTQSEKERT